MIIICFSDVLHSIGMASHSQSVTLQPADTHNSVIIRMKRKRQAAPLESFFIESDATERTFLKSKPKNSKTVFVRTTSIDPSSPTESCMGTVLGHHLAKSSVPGDEIGGKMKRLKLGDMAATPTEDSNKAPNSVHVFDIVQDSITDEYTLLPSDLTQTETHAPYKPIVTCNGDEMIREILPNPHQQSPTSDDTYVYDLYLTEDADLSMFDDPTSILINPLEYDINWVDPVTKVPHPHYLDELDDDELTDDSNAENHSRNEYPEQPDSDSASDNEYSSRYERDSYPGYFQCNQNANLNDPWASELSHLKREKDLYYDDEVLRSDED